MTLIGFRAQNHPQQRTKAEVDDRAVTDAAFAPLHRRFEFTIDAAAAPHNAKLPRYWTVDDDALAQDWSDERVWCNPPYSNIRPWVQKAWDQHINGCPLIVMLLPANRTEQGWWQDHVEPSLRIRADRFRVEFLPGRMRFDRPGVVIPPKGDRPPFGSCLLVWGA